MSYFFDIVNAVPAEPKPDAERGDYFFDVAQLDAETRNTIRRAFYFAKGKGTDAERDAFEDLYGASLTNILDDMADAAHEAGDDLLRDRLIAAFNKLTGR
jgi:hypothetical protein